MKNKSKIESVYTLLKEAKEKVDIARRKGTDDINELMEEVVMLTEIYRLNVSNAGKSTK